MGILDRKENKQFGADRRMFAKAIMWATVALFVILIAALFIARPAAKKIQPITPNGRSAVQVLQIQRLA